MPLLADRVLETSITSGTGTLTLAGAVSGYRSFNSAFTNGNIVYYTIDDGLGNWEVGYGAVGTGTLSRSTVLESSNANALVSFSSATKRVYCTAPVPALLPDQTGNNTKVLTTNGTTPSWTTPNAGTVTTVSVVSANGFTGTVATATTTPAITITTSITGLLKGNGTAISVATVGTDYSVGTSALTTGILKSTTTTGALSIAVAADFPTLNQNTTGTAAGLSATLAVASGGTGVTAAGTSGNVLTSNGTAWVSQAPAASGISTGKAIAMALIFGF